MSAHSEHGASSCARWWHCPGSVALSRGIARASSPYAAEGTAAHALAELCLTNGQDAEEYTGRTVEGFNVDADMAEHVGFYVRHCRALGRITTLAGQVIEQRFTLDAINPPAPMFGTADFVAWSTDVLWVRDLKYGQGVQVEADGNLQLRYYALGALLALPPEAARAIRLVSMTIIQPRAPGGPAIRTADMPALDLVEWSMELMSRAAATLRPGAPLHPGSWCRFCAASGRCPARAEQAAELARAEFTDVTLLTPEQMGALLAQADKVESFLRDLRTAATAELSRGGSVPGWKLVPTRPAQAWRDEAEAEAALDVLHELGEARFAPRKLVTPAQARAVLSDQVAHQHSTKKAAEQAARDALAHLICTASSGARLAPATDTRPALPAAGIEFTALPAPGDSV